MTPRQTYTIYVCPKCGKDGPKGSHCPPPNHGEPNQPWDEGGTARLPLTVVPK